MCLPVTYCERAAQLLDLLVTAEYLPCPPGQRDCSRAVPSAPWQAWRVPYGCHACVIIRHNRARRVRQAFLRPFPAGFFLHRNPCIAMWSLFISLQSGFRSFSRRRSVLHPQSMGRTVFQSVPASACRQNPAKSKPLYSRSTFRIIQEQTTHLGDFYIDSSAKSHYGCACFRRIWFPRACFGQTGMSVPR